MVHLTTTDMSLDWLLGPQLRAFLDAGYEVIGMSAAGPHVHNLEQLGVVHVPVPAFTRDNNVLHDMRAFGQLIRLFRVVRPDIVHTHNPKPGVLGRIAARLARVPYVVNTQHGLYAQPTDRRRRRWPVYAAERVAAAFSHAELVQNPEDVDTLVKVLRVPARKVHLLGNGIDLGRFNPASVGDGERASRRAEWRVGDSDILCGAVGRLVREKGIAEIIEAAGLLNDRGANVKFVVIGPAEPGKSDAIDTEVLEQAAKAGVVFVGQRADMAECYAAMDMFVTASWREGFPRAAMEAAAMGLAIVASDIRGNRQVVENGVTGVVVPVRDPRALAHALGGLAAEPDRRQSMGAAAMRKAATEFDQQLIVDRTLTVYRQAGAV